MTCAFVVHSMLLVAIPVYALELGASAFMLGVIFSAPYLLPLLIAIPLGQIVVRYGGRRLMWTGGTMMIAGLLVIVGFPGYGGLLAGQLLIGLAQLQMVLSGQAVVAGLGRGKSLERYFGWYTTWISAGQVVGPLVAGALIDWQGSTLPAFWVMVSITLVGLMSAIGLSGIARQGTAVDRGNTGYLAQVRLLKRNTGVQVSVAVTLTAMFVMGIHGSYLPVYLEDIGIAASVIGVLVSLRSLASMLIRPFMPRLVSTLGNRKMAMMVSLMALAFGLALLGVSESAIVIGLFSVLIGVGSGISQPLSIVVLAESVSDEQRPGALGMRLMANRVVNFLGPLLFGAVLHVAGFTTTFLVAGVLVVVAAFSVSRFPEELQAHN
ncbi:MAG: MFS transporter [Pseudomonadota bacterium]